MKAFLVPGYLLGLLFGLSVWLPAPAHAAGQAHDWYVVEIPVADQSDDERRKALRSGLQQILVRISGQSDVSNNPQVLAALGNPEVYVQEFSYSAQGNVPVKAPGKVSGKPASAEVVSTLTVKAQFSAEALRALLRKAGLPLWPSRRPSMLVWVVVDNSSSRQSLGQLPAEQTALMQEANRRGLSLVMPMNDLTDQLALGAERLMLLDEASIREASQRYGESAVMAGRITRLSATEWQGSWRFLMADASYTMDMTVEDVSDFLAAGVDGAVQQMLSRYAIPPDSLSTPVTLEISGIDTVARYADVLHLLKNIESVKSVAVSEVNQKTLYCVLDTEGSVAVLQALIGLENHLVSEDAPLAAITTPSIELEKTDPAAPAVAPQQPAVSTQPTVLHYHFVSP